MRGKKTRYTFVIEFLGGTFVHQGTGESPELALRSYLRFASEDDDWTAYRVDLLAAMADDVASPVEGCQNVWSMSGVAAEHLYLIHIIGTESGATTRRALVAEASADPVAESRRWGLGDRW